jgi:predicted glycosyltransferase
MKSNNRTKALFRHLVEEEKDYEATQEENFLEDYDVSKYDDAIFESGNVQFLVVTQEEAKDMAQDYIYESIWAFNPEFLINHMPRGVTIETIQKLQELYEGCNDSLKSMITDLDDFVEDAISSDGVARFLNTYDDQEWEYKIGDEYYYVYRLN